jgi:hypothetical protein
VQGFQLTASRFLLRYPASPDNKVSLFLFSELIMKMIVAVPIALLTIGALGCSQHASTAPAVERPAASAASETNTFGESKDEAAGSAASARAANYGTEPAPAADSTPPAAPADSTPPK